MTKDDIQAVCNYIGSGIKFKHSGGQDELKVLHIYDVIKDLIDGKEIKLILRPIKDITEEEVEKLMKLSHRGTEKGSIDYMIEHFDMKAAKFNIDGGDYLRSQGIDIPYRNKTLKERRLAIYRHELNKTQDNE